MLKTVLAALCVAVAAAAGPAAAQGASPTLAKIKAAKAINVAYSPDSAPFSSATGNAAPQGYSIELCKRVVAQIARAVGEPELKINWLAAPVAERCRWWPAAAPRWTAPTPRRRRRGWPAWTSPT